MLKFEGLISKVESVIDELEIKLENCQDDDSFQETRYIINELCEMLDWLYSVS